MTHRRVKLLVVAREHLMVLIRGEGRIGLPHDAEILGVATQADGALQLQVHSAAYPLTPEGVALPTAPATLQRGRRA